jgi:hypothetical protein
MGKVVVNITTSLDGLVAESPDVTHLRFRIVNADQKRETPTT